MCFSAKFYRDLRLIYLLSRYIPECGIWRKLPDTYQNLKQKSICNLHEAWVFCFSRIGIGIKFWSESRGHIPFDSRRCSSLAIQTQNFLIRNNLFGLAIPHGPSNKNEIVTVSPVRFHSLTLKHRETHGCVVSTVATDALVLKHQAISIHNAD